MSNGGTPTRSAAKALRPLSDLSADERESLRRLARQYQVRGDGSLRPAADVAYDLRARHKVEVAVQDVHALLAEEAES